MPTDKELKKLVKLLKEAKPKFNDILEADPWDIMRDKMKLIPPPLFFEKLFVDAAEIQSLAGNLNDMINSPRADHPLIFVSGFSGSGKSTFLRYFENINPDFEHHFVDFHLTSHLDKSEQESNETRDILINNLFSEIIQYEKDSQSLFKKPDITVLIKSLTKISKETDPIQTVLKGWLKSSKCDKDKLHNVLYHIKTSIDSISEYFSPEFSSIINSIKKSKIAHLSKDILELAFYDDIFLLFFLYHIECFKDKKPYIIYFDNLDKLTIDYISDTFERNFPHIILKLQSILHTDDFSQKRVDFMRDFRLIFCLRDANSAVINEHVLNSLGSKLKRISFFNIQYKPNYYKDILLKRLNFIHELYEFDQDEDIASTAIQVSKVIDIFLKNETDFGIEESNFDNYFKDVMVPLFNFDMKKLMSIISDAASESEENIITSHDSDILKTEDRLLKGLHRYGLRGGLLFHIVKSLKTFDYLHDYSIYRYPVRKNEGYCLHIRMILSLVLNNCNYDVNAHQVEPNTIEDYCDLQEVLESFFNIYPCEEVLGTLADCFLFHERNWVNLITIRNILVKDETTFSPFVDKLKRFDKISEENNFELDLHELIDQDLSKKLKNIKIKINPSAFIFLRYVIVHFEFYSNLAGNKIPLFKFVHLSDFDSLKPKYEFESTIDSVYEEVSKHCNKMNKFFKNIFVKRLNYLPDKYRKSEFAFKYHGKNVKSASGYFHSTRIINSVIDYIDSFRRYLLLKIDNDVIRAKMNERIINSIERFIYLLKHSEDDRTNTFEIEYIKIINKIKGYKYLDTTSRIALPQKDYYL